MNRRKTKMWLFSIIIRVVPSRLVTTDFSNPMFCRIPVCTGKRDTMLSRRASLIALGLLLLGPEGHLWAGGIHIVYGHEAPEKLAATNVRYYEGVLKLEHNHPRAFAKEHPFYTKMFEDPARVDKLTARWEAHEQRFEYWHLCLWKVLDGYETTHHAEPGHLATSLPSSPIVVGSGGVSDRGSNLPQSLGPGGNPPGEGGRGSAGGGTTTLAVPEPSGVLLMVAGALIAGTWLWWRGR